MQSETHSPQQLELEPYLESLQRVPIASKDDIKRMLSEQIFNPKLKPSDRTKAAEMICKIDGHFSKSEPPSSDYDQLLKDIAACLPD